MKVNHHHYLHVGEDIFGSIAGFLSYLEKSVMNELEILKAQLAANTTAISWLARGYGDRLAKTRPDSCETSRP